MLDTAIKRTDYKRHLALLDAEIQDKAAVPERRDRAQLFAGLFAMHWLTCWIVRGFFGDGKQDPST